MRLIKSKRSSLSISINAIVIIVLAMTFLGLGLGFVRNMFAGITETTFTVQDQIKQQILDDLRTGNKRLSFPTNEIKIGYQKSKVLAIGVKNTESESLQFKINLFDVTTAATADDAINIGTTTEALDVGTFFWDKGQQELAVNEANVFPIKFTSGSKPATYIIKIVIDRTGTPGGEYASKSFFITIG